MLVIPEPKTERPIAQFLRSIPLPRGAQWYLVVYRWLLVAACLYTVAVQWNLWQDRSDPNWQATKIGTPTNSNLQFPWNNRPPDAQLAPMLPVWDRLPQFSLGWLLIGSLLVVLVRPRIGLTAIGILLALGILMDRTRIQPHYMMVLLMVGTLPSRDAQLIGRASLIALWFWAGFHKFIIDFIKPDGMFGFAGNIIPLDLARFFPPETYGWNKPWLGVAIGWIVATTEMLLGLMCLFPPARMVVAVMAVVVHAGIIYWNCWQWRSNLIGWNLALALAGVFLILPWREWPWVTWKQCRLLARGVSVFLLIYPAGYYLNWVNAYFSYCVYVPNTPNCVLHRPGEPTMPAGMLPYEIVNAVLPPGHSITEAYFEKIRRPGDVMVIHDPRPWAQRDGMNGRQLTDLGEFRRGKHWQLAHPDGSLAGEGNQDATGRLQGLWREWYSNGQPSCFGLMVDGQAQGHWYQWYANGKKKSEGDFNNGLRIGHWTTWYEDGAKETEGDFKDDLPDGLWMDWTAEGEASRMKFKNGLPVPDAQE